MSEAATTDGEAVRVCVCVCVHTYMHAYSVCMYVYVCIHTYMHAYSVCMYVYVCIHTYIHTYIQYQLARRLRKTAKQCVCVCVCTYTYIHTCIKCIHTVPIGEAATKDGEAVLAVCGHVDDELACKEYRRHNLQPEKCLERERERERMCERERDRE